MSEIAQKTLAAWVVIAVLGSCAFTIWTAPNSYLASRDFAVAFDAARVNPITAIRKLAEAAQEYPYEPAYRRELFKPFTTLASMGYEVPRSLADAAYTQSRLAGGDAPDILLSRIWFLTNSRVTSDGAQRAEAQALYARLIEINPKFPELYQTGRALDRAGMK